uniref:Putative recombination protein n=1 Tax=Streptomyces tenjimariensis TaxID=29308 RepID=Q2UZA0_9ACTN|nr:putative recombination protein [Streptomyces tenjimariensis]
MRYFRESMQNTMSLCQYNVRAFTAPEIDAIEEYDDQVPFPAYFELETLLADTDDTAGAFRQRAEELTRWHDALNRLLTDTRLKNTCDDEEPYSPAVRRFLKGAAGDYHRHRHGYEYAVTVWALGLQAPTGYPPETRSLNLANRELRLWD